VKHVDIYTDGACIGNPGPGGYGTILRYNGTEKELSEGYRLTTNNRMELLAVVKGLEALKEPCEADIHADSLYVINGIDKGWAKSWRANGWRTKGKTPALNSDLWQRLLDLCDAHTVRWHWVKGHAGHPENERCDRLANAAALTAALLTDDVYEALQVAPASGRGLF
jgi:ribonuclease HI